MKPHCTALAALLLPLCASAAVPFDWVADVDRPAPVPVPVLRGETVDLRAALVHRGRPFDPAAESAMIYWQTNGMGDAWWSAPADISSNVLSATWTPAMDPGAALVTAFIGTTGEDGRSYRAWATLRILHAPGAIPNELPLPVPSIDFAAVSWSNAPWVAKAGDSMTGLLKVAGANLPFHGGVNPMTYVGANGVSIIPSVNDPDGERGSARYMRDRIQILPDVRDDTSKYDVSFPDSAGKLALVSQIPAAQVNADWNAVSGMAQILNKPALGTAAAKNVPSSGNASSAQVVLGNDTRLEDARTPTAHTHASSDVSLPPSFPSGGSLADWLSMTDSFLGQFPSPNDIICQDYEGNLYKQGLDGFLYLTSPPKVNGTPLALATHTHASLVSADTKTTVTANNDGTLSITRPGAEIDEADPLSSLADCLGLGDNATLNDVRTALGLPETATLDDARRAVPSFINDIITTKTYVDDALAAKANASDIRYRLVTATPTVSGTMATVACEDRAITTAEIASGITSVRLSFPAAVAGRARDFFVRLDCKGANVASVLPPSDATLDFGSSDLEDIAGVAGTHLVLFSEIAAGHWLASVRKAE